MYRVRAYTHEGVYVACNAYIVVNIYSSSEYSHGM